MARARRARTRGVEGRRAEWPVRGQTRARLVWHAMADPGRRSRAWAVLAVALALMALVTALSSTAGHRRPAEPAAAFARAAAGTRPTTLPPGSGNLRPTDRATRIAPDAQVPDGGRAGTGRWAARALEERALAPPPASAVFTTTGNAVPFPSATANRPSSNGGSSSGSASPIAAAASSASSASQAGSPSTRAATSTSPPTQAGADSAGSGAGGTGISGGSGMATATPSGAYPGRGSIEPPSTSVSFAAAGGGTVSAQATWTGVTDLELQISCPGGVSVTRAGASSLSVEVDDGHGTGTCTVTLSLMPGTHTGVSFTLVVDPGP